MRGKHFTQGVWSPAAGGPPYHPYQTLGADHCLDGDSWQVHGHGTDYIWAKSQPKRRKG